MGWDVEVSHWSVTTVLNLISDGFLSSAPTDERGILSISIFSFQKFRWIVDNFHILFYSSKINIKSNISKGIPAGG